MSLCRWRQFGGGGCFSGAGVPELVSGRDAPAGFLVRSTYGATVRSIYPVEVNFAAAAGGSTNDQQPLAVFCGDSLTHRSLRAAPSTFL